MKIEHTIYKWLLTVAVGCSALSCDVLDIMQDNQLSVSNMWKTSVQVEGSTYGIYSELRANFVQSQINVFYWGELRVGEYMWGPSRLFNVWVGREVIQNTMTANITSCGWSGLYSVIDQSNAVLKYAPSESIAMTDEKRNWAMGQAYFARAYAYFWAARLWGDVPLNLRPIESVNQPETYPVRAPKADVYARIGSDIESALALADYLGTDKYLATRTAVLMLKAEYSLWMYANQGGGDSYLDSAESALNAIGISSSLLCDDYGDIFDRMADNTKPSKNSKEVVFALYNDQSESKTGGYSWYFAYPEAYVAKSYQGNPVPIYETQWLDYGEEFLAKLRDSRDNRGDTRVKYNLGEGNYGADGGELTFCRKFLGDMSAGKMVLDADLIYYRAALAVMMDAELKYYRKDYSGALKSLNIIAERAYGKANYYTDASQEAVLDALVDEYFLEFPAEGVIWWALIRLDKIWDYNPYLNEHRNDTNILLWPISKSARDKNSALTQTEGWY